MYVKQKFIFSLSHSITHQIKDINFWLHALFSLYIKKKKKEI